MQLFKAVREITMNNPHFLNLRKLGMSPGWFRRSCSVRPVVVLLVFLLFGGNAKSAQMITLVPAEPTLDWRFELEERGCTHRICELMTRLAMKQKGQQPSTCGLLEDPEAIAVGISFPVWTRQNFREHREEIRNALMEEHWHLGSPPPDKVEFDKHKEDIWARFGSGMMQLFESGEATFETTTFDVDDDDVPENLFRVPLIWPVDMGPARMPLPDTKWHLSRCDPREGSGNAALLYHNFLLPESAVRTSNPEYYEHLSRRFREFGLGSLARLDGRSFRFQPSIASAELAELDRVDRAQGGSALQVRRVWWGWFEPGRVKAVPAPPTPRRR